MYSLHQKKVYTFVKPSTQNCGVQVESTRQQKDGLTMSIWLFQALLQVYSVLSFSGHYSNIINVLVRTGRLRWLILPPPLGLHHCTKCFRQVFAIVFPFPTSELIQSGIGCHLCWREASWSSKCAVRVPWTLWRARICKVSKVHLFFCFVWFQRGLKWKIQVDLLITCIHAP